MESGIRSKRRERRPAFNDAEAEYLAENILGRVATVSRDLQPHVVPVVYRFDGSHIIFSGWNLTASLKYRQLVENRKVAFVVDDLASTSPWRTRGVEVRGLAEPVISGGSTAVMITPVETRSWGLGE